MASHGESQVEMAGSHKPEVILLDINMPKLTGLAALAILRTNPATAKIPVIAISSEAHHSNIKAGLKAGFFRYITKPYKLDELMDAVDAALLCGVSR